MPLDLPDSGRVALTHVVDATPEFLDALYNALKECRPAMWRTQWIDEVAPKLERLSADPEAVDAIVRMLFGLLAIPDGPDKEILVEELITAARTSGDEKLSEISTREWDRVRPYLVKFLGLDTLGLSAKAANLFSQTPRHMHSARVITDVRPIFGDEADGGPTGLVLIHTLKVQYFEDGEEKDWFIALDSDDIDLLYEAMQRARQKESSLSKKLKTLSIPIFTYMKDLHGDS